MGYRIFVGRNLLRVATPYWLVMLMVCFFLAMPGCGGADSDTEGEAQSAAPLVIPDELTKEPSAERVAALVEKGREAFIQSACITCHMVNGEPLTGPGLSGIMGQPITLADGTEIDRDLVYLYKSIVVPNQYVSQAGPVVMPPYAFLDEETLVSLVYFIASLSTPAEVQGGEAVDE